MVRTTPRALAALSQTAQHALDALVAAGRPIEQDVVAALDGVAAYARGEPSTKAARARDASTITRLAGRYSVHGPDLDKAYMWTVGAVGTLCRMAATGEDHDALVRTHLAYGLMSLAHPTPHATVAEWHASALARTASLSGEQVAAQRVDPKRAAAEAAALARVKKALGRSGALLAKTNARYERKAAGDRAKLKALLARKKYPAHAAVLAFDAMFGGLVIPDAHATADEMCTLVGAYACVSSKGHKRPSGTRADLVPIAYTSNDGIFFIDKAGKVLFEDTIEGPAASAYAPSGRAALTKLLRWILAQRQG